ncbi:unnamed protein product, partial [marine sediment metagenome]
QRKKQIFRSIEPKEKKEQANLKQKIKELNKLLRGYHKDIGLNSQSLRKTLSGYSNRKKDQRPREKRAGRCQPKTCGFYCKEI